MCLGVLVALATAACTNPDTPPAEGTERGSSGASVESDDPLEAPRGVSDAGEDAAVESASVEGDAVGASVAVDESGATVGDRDIAPVVIEHGDPSEDPVSADAPPVFVELPALAEAVGASAGLAGLISLTVDGFCGVRPDGALECWDVLGDLEEVPAGQFRAVSLGGLTPCGLRVDGSVDCWSRFGFASGGPEVPAGAFVAVSSGGYRACGLRSAGGLECWSQPLGRWREEEALAWSAAHPGGVFSVVSAGYAHICGLRADGTVECWGEDWFGQSRAPAGRFLAVDAGVSHSCGLRPDGEAECWGEDSIDSGSVGLVEQRYRGGEEDYLDKYSPAARGSVSGEDPLSPREFFHFMTIEGTGVDEAMLGVLVERASGWESPRGPFKAISAGAGFTCGLRLDGEVACWGYVADEEPRIPLAVYAEVAGDQVREAYEATAAERQSRETERDAARQSADGARNRDGAGGGEPDDGDAASTGLGYQFELVAFRTVLGYVAVVDPPAGPFVAIDAGRRRACGLRPDGEVECWGAELFDSDEPRTLDQFATEAVPVDVSSASNSGDAVAAAGEVTGDHGGGVVGGVEAPGEAGAAARGALGLHVRASSAGPTPPAAGEVVPWPLVTWPPEAPASLCESALVPGGPLESLVDPRIVDGWIGLPAARFVPGVAVELETAFLRPNSTVRLSVVGGPVPRAGEPVGDFGALVPVEFPPATADPQGELSLAWTVPEAPAGRVGPMWYLVRGPGVAQLTHHTLDVRLTHPIIAYPDVAPCAVDDEATTTAATSVRVDVVANDIAPTGGTLDPASVTIVRPRGGEFVAHPDGSVTFTPEADFTGTARARYAVYDTWNIAALADVIVTVNKP